MAVYNPEYPLISIHIPKCAGTSFYNVLKKWFGRKLLRHYHNEKFNRPPKKHKLTAFLSKKFKYQICIHGHFNNKRGNGVSDYYPEVNQYITILRDPFEIHLSNYFYVKKLGKKAFRDGKHHEIIEKNLSLQQYLSYSNRSFYLSFLPQKISIDNYNQILDERFVYIGITEDLQASVNSLSEKLGFSTVSLPVKNISQRTEDVTEDMRNKFIQNNPLEMAIYEYALARYKDK